MIKKIREELKIRREIVSPPGDTIQETLDAIGMTQRELAGRLGKDPKNINRIISGIEALSEQTAIGLQAVLDIPAEFWLEREKRYRLKLKQIDVDENLLGFIKWLKSFPYSEMAGLGWVRETKHPVESIQNLIRFFRINSPERWEDVFFDQKLSTAFRVSLKSANNPYAVSAWLQQGENEAAEMELPAYEAKTFLRNLLDARKLTLREDGFLEELKNLCADSGVALVLTPTLPKVPVSGSSRWIKSNTVPLIQLSDRYKNNASFWLTFFHEAGHVLLHGKKDVFIEGAEGIENDRTKEAEADRFARRHLLGSGFNVLAGKDISKAAIRAYAEQQGIHPGIVAEAAQNYGIAVRSK